MNILVLGSGGREDALSWRLSQSPSCDKLICAPGNPGMARWAERLASLDPCDADAVIALASEEAIDLVVVGPEAPLVAGVADKLRDAGFAVLGPSAAAAQLEGSKGFTKDLCARANIPTAGYVRTTTVTEGLEALEKFGAPVVVKADGLAAGKGVTVAMTMDEARAAVKAAGDGEMVIEEYLEGEEASLFAFVDGKHVCPIGSAQDHKRVGEGDVGPNTGGMGAYSPAPVLTDELTERAMDEILRPTAETLAEEGMPFNGILYAGLMLTSDGPKLIEYNVRFGDPECQVVMPRIEGDFAAMCLAVAAGDMETLPVIELEDAHVMTVVIAAQNYPGTPKKGGTITGIEAAEEDGAIVFQAGTAEQDGKLVASGGRVLAVTAAGATLAEARDAAYAAVDKIDYADGFHRRDIGWRELERVS
ncbi:phosphoribosylamine--glycine ligase [Sphingomicrobium clamense]|uniref:Phosphoribosylamine--glycine ligase n=1 Tax=Sphingomicrobium clamense TaxID=2851013 RepID=A0ABS6V3N9_9SPHN|nr:phosphoribosylamine--glycine ligase [Sphingomicrobium sp. B8]MBW0144177.1 phosphoribosylamine--glycine ligase [Sphingomicrobium sp. B8]